MDKAKVEAQARHIRIPAAGELATPEQLEGAVEALIQELRQVADFSTPRAKASTGRSSAWWDATTRTAVEATRKAGRRWRTGRTQPLAEEFTQAKRDQAKAVKLAKQRHWRQLLARASGDQRLFWVLERWARIRSHAAAEPAKLPPIRRAAGTRLEEWAQTHQEKCETLCERFFPNPVADLLDITDTGFPRQSFAEKFQVPQEVDEDDIKEALKRPGQWKAPGPDLFPTGFLKACGGPLRRALAAIASASLAIGHYPQQFRSAIVIVLRKPGKTVEQLREAGAYRPISLLSTLGKEVESVVGRRVAEAAEEHGLLPETQMGNRPGRSTELALRLVTDIVHTAWREGAIASLAQLDIKGAFDTVNHIRLLDTLRGMGFPPWVVWWIRSFLAGRSARLRFDGEESTRIDVRAGVPQGSPLSPILFILYTASLYRNLAARKGLGTVGSPTT